MPELQAELGFSDNDEPDFDLEMPEIDLQVYPEDFRNDDDDSDIEDLLPRPAKRACTRQLPFDRDSGQDPTSGTAGGDLERIESDSDDESHYRFASGTDRTEFEFAMP